MMEIIKKITVLGYLACVVESAILVVIISTFGYEKLDVLEGIINGEFN